VQCMQLDAGIFAKSNKNACSEQIYNVSDKSFYFCARNFSMLILVSLLTGICKKRSCSYEKNDICPLLLQPWLYAR